MWISFPNCICTVSGFGSGAKKLYSICCSHQNCAVKSLTLTYPKPPLNLSRGVRSPGLVFLEVASTSDDSKWLVVIGNLVPRSPAAKGDKHKTEWDLSMRLEHRYSQLSQWCSDSQGWSDLGTAGTQRERVLFSRRYMKGNLFSQKWYTEGVRWGGAEPSHVKLPWRRGQIIGTCKWGN